MANTSQDDEKMAEAGTSQDDENLAQEAGTSEESDDKNQVASTSDDDETPAQEIFYQHSQFYPQPGDIILRQKPHIKRDGTAGSFVKLYKDPLYFAGKNSHRKAIPMVHNFQRGDKVLRLFKLYKNWEFLHTDTHMIFLYYSRVAKLRPWFLVSLTNSMYHHDTYPAATHFTHLPPSTKTFTELGVRDFSPGLGDIIIHTIPDTHVKTPVMQQCPNCLKLEKKAFMYHSPGNFFSINVLNAYDWHMPQEYDLSKGCEQCEFMAVNMDEIEATELPWQERWEIEYWTEDYAPKANDILVRYQVDMHYTPGTYHNTHLQVELFKYIAWEDMWTYLGMDVEDFGPEAAKDCVIERPLPGDITISRHKEWFIEWDPYRKTGGYVVLHKDPFFFKDINHEDEDGDLYAQFTSERKAAKFKEVPADSWLVRVGKFDEYWDFLLDGHAEVFVMHPNKLTMACHSIIKYRQMAQLPNYDFDKWKQPPELLAPVEITPNHWDLIIRQSPKVGERNDPTDWRREAEKWMRDPMLWGRDVPITYDKDVEILLYCSLFKFETHDLLLRAGFDASHLHPEGGPPMHPMSGPNIYSSGGPNMNPPNYTEQKLETHYGPQISSIMPTIYTGATVELYHVEVGAEEDDPTVFRFMGRDRFLFPNEPYYKEPFFTRSASEEEEVSSASQRGEPMNIDRKGKKIIEDSMPPDKRAGKDSEKGGKPSESKKRPIDELQDEFNVLTMAEPSKKGRWHDNKLTKSEEEEIYEDKPRKKQKWPTENRQDEFNVLEKDKIVLTLSEEEMYS